MELAHTQKLLALDTEKSDPRELLSATLRSSIELLSLEGNDFAWSSWRGSADAIEELQRILDDVDTGGMPDRLTLSVIFAPTGPMQEVSLSSGWGQAFIRVAECYDSAEKRLFT